MNNITSAKIKDFLPRVNQCVRCGRCKSHCPLFLETRREIVSARGKIALIRTLIAENIPFSQKVSAYIFLCLLCGNCSKECVNGLEIEEIVRDLRSELVKRNGLPLLKRTILKLIFETPSITFKFLKGFSSFIRIFHKGIPKDSGLRIRLPVPFLKGKFIPDIPKVSFLKGLEKKKETLEKDRALHIKVGIFSGCTTNFIFPRVGEALLNLLSSLEKVSSIIPLEQKCCGLPFWAIGEDSRAYHLALKNIEVFEKYNLDYIVTPCSSCSHHMSMNYSRVFKDSPLQLQNRVGVFSKRIHEATYFLTNILGYDNNISQNQHVIKREFKRIAYHDPCHTRKNLSLYKDSRRLIESLCQESLIELEDKNRCCGGGGIFGLFNKKLSKEILRHKVKDIRNSQSDVVATTCMGCILQLKEGICREGLPIEVKHPLELI